jgi:hypothetical protein
MSTQAAFVNTALVPSVKATIPQYVAKIKEWAGAHDVYTIASEVYTIASKGGWQSVLEQFPTIPDFEKRKPDILKIIAEGMNESDQRILEECSKYKGQQHPMDEEVKRKRKLAIGVNKKRDVAYHALGAHLYPNYRSVCSSLPFVIHPLC